MKSLERHLHKAGLFTGLLIGLTSGSQTAWASSINLCEGLISHNQGVVIPMVKKPPYMRYYKEPAFGTKVIRITNNRENELSKPPYSTMQAWNSNESYMLQYHNGEDFTGHRLLDGHTYEIVRNLSFVPSDLEDVFWSHTDPDTLYYISKVKPNFGEFMKYSIGSDKSVVVKDFTRWCGSDMPKPGGDVQMQSLDDDLFGFRCVNLDEEPIMLTYKISTDTVTTARIGEGTRWEEWFAPMPTVTGKSWFFQGVSLDHDLKTVNVELDMKKAGEHQNVGLTHDGQDAIYSVGFDPSPNGCNGDPDEGIGHVVQHNLETGECRNFISQSEGYPYTTSATHISAQAVHNPGWVAVSSIGKKKQFNAFTTGRPAPPLLSEIYLLNTDPDDTVVCRVAHHRSFGKRADAGDYHPYFGEPHATISPSGTRIMFGSDWYDSGSVDSYIIELPAYSKP